MADRLVVDIEVDGRVTLSRWPAGQAPHPVPGASSQLTMPLGPDDREDLRWYLEDYLPAPFGVYEQRGAEVADRLREWGRRMFGAAFGPEAARREVDGLTAAASPDDRPEIVFRSARPEWLALPWELLTAPGAASPTALRSVSLSRSLPGVELERPVTASGERLRVLMVIARPRGTDDVGYRMIARPLLERLEAVRGAVELVVLRPPTRDALAATLQDARAGGRPFQIVHFDGHGELASSSGPGAHDTEPEGRLIFESPRGRSHPVPAAEVARILGAAEVPVVVLNACQSGALGKSLESAVATALLAEGVTSVVAMAYRIYAVAAATFVVAFYDRLFAGDRISDAVAAGRSGLAKHALRPSPRGMLRLDDWIVPVHYRRGEARFVLSRVRDTDADAEPARAGAAADGSDPGRVDDLAPQGTFVGRDTLFQTLEVATRNERVVVVHGSGGIGKTELAKAFGRWWRDTGGIDRPDLVVWHSFETGVTTGGLDGVLASIGHAAVGLAFGELDDAERRATVRTLLAERRVLLIFDNVESLCSMPERAEPLDDGGRRQLVEFLAEVRAGGRAAVLITSRSRETWLGEALRIELGGLDVEEAVEYADELLAPYPTAAARRARREFGELMTWLDGHPLSMRLTLPLLATTEPDVLLAGLQGVGPGPAEHDTDTDDRTTSLAACLTYSYDRLDPAARRLLSAVCVFPGALVLPDILARFAAVPGVPDRFAGTDDEQWRAAFDAAVGVGLLTRPGGGSFGVHPALPGYLAARWRAEEPTKYVEQRDASERAVLRVYASLARFLAEQHDHGEAQSAILLIDRNRQTFTRLLRLAADRGDWASAHLLVVPITLYWDARGLFEEANWWTDHLRRLIEGPGGTAPDLTTEAGMTWLYVVVADASRRLEIGGPAEAEQSLRRLYDEMVSQYPSRDRADVADVCQQLGRAAHLSGAVEEAEAWYRRSLGIRERLGNRQGIGRSHHVLGTLAQARDAAGEAQQHLEGALSIAVEVNDRGTAAASSFHLGMLAHARGAYDEAIERYVESLRLSEELAHRQGGATVYRQLGALERDRAMAQSVARDPLGSAGDAAPDPAALEAARTWFLSALSVSTSIGDRRATALTYQHLGVISMDAGRMQEARKWVREASTLDEELGNWRGLALDHVTWGQIAQREGALDEAEEHFRRSLELGEGVAGPAFIAQVCGHLGALAAVRGAQGVPGAAGAARTWLHRALALREEVGDPAGIVSTCQQLASAAYARGDLEEAEEWFRRCLQLQTERADPAGRQLIYCALGQLAEARAEPLKAEDLYQHALRINEGIGHAAGVRHIYGLIGTSALKRGAFDESRVWFGRALSLSAELGDRAGEADVHARLGVLAQQEADIDAAYTEFRAALGIHEELGDRAAIASGALAVGMFAMAQGAQDEAEASLRRSLELNEDFGNRSATADCHQYLGAVEQARFRWAEALVHYERAAAIQEVLEDRGALAYIYNLTGGALLFLKRVDESDRDYEKSLALSVELGNRRLEADNCRQLTGVALMQGRLVEAKRWHDRRTAIERELRG